MQKFEETEPLYKLEELKSSLKPFRFNVMFTASNSIFAKTHLETLNSDKISSKFGNIFSRIKSVISNNNNKVIKRFSRLRRTNTRLITNIFLLAQAKSIARRFKSTKYSH